MAAMDQGELSLSDNDEHADAEVEGASDGSAGTAAKSGRSGRKRKFSTSAANASAKKRGKQTSNKNGC